MIYEDDFYTSLEKAEAIVLLTEWPEYAQIDWARVPKALVLDGRNHLDHQMLRTLGFEIIVLAGLLVYISIERFD